MSVFIKATSLAENPTRVVRVEEVVTVLICQTPPRKRRSRAEG